MEYVRLCHKEKMETIIMMVESEIPISVTTNNYSIVESLGWDCIGNDYFSFMFEFFENPDLFCDLSVELNNNLLFANAEQAKKFIKPGRRTVTDTDERKRISGADRTNGQQ